MKKINIPKGKMRGGGGGSGIISSNGNIRPLVVHTNGIIDYLLIFILFLLFGAVAYMFYVYVVKDSTIKKEWYHDAHQPLIISTTSNLEKINDPYVPPLKKNSWLPSSWFYSAPSPHYHVGNIDPRYTIDNSIYRGHHSHAVNIKTRGIDMPFEQVGFIKDGENILPLMGRNIDNGRDKSQYYTVTNQGTINTKLPVKVNGRNCSGEYGCDSVYDGDNIYVDGLDRNFTAKIYDNAPLLYLA